MSVAASIDLRIIEMGTGNIVPAVKILQMLKQSGWTVKHDGYITYLPLGDEADGFNWIGEEISIESFMEIVEKKEKQNEPIGVLITWKDSEIGGEVLLWKKNEKVEKGIHITMSLCLTNNRKTLTDEGFPKITDINWYLTKLLPIFNQGDTLVEYFTFEEHI